MDDVLYLAVGLLFLATCALGAALLERLRGGSS